MAVTVTPRLTLSANGASALVDTAGRGFRVYEVPDGRMRWDLGDGEDLSLATLSASGNALAWVGEAGDLTVLSGAGRVAGRLPASRDRVRAVAPSDDGDLVACLIAGGVEDDGDVGESRLVIAPSANGGAVAAVGLPVYETGFVLANDDCSLILAGSSEHLGERRVVRAFVREDDELRSLWAEGTALGAYGALAVYGDWVFAATAEGIVGWRRNGERVSLPGSMRERMVFSRDGRHLM
ncbi:MAG TPA: hypothetical protein VKB09_09470, partial [Thermomicrobiales bacterium]|nr:hypothetical protein [Thermomicrobiales bacterium]